MNLIKTSLYTSVSTAVTFISGFIIIKAVAIKIGPAGIAYLGQFQNTTAIIALLGAGAISSGVIKYIAQYRGDIIKQQQLITMALSVTLICSLSVSVLVMLASGYLSKATFHTANFWEVYFLYGSFVAIISLNGLFSAVLNGLKEIKKLTILNITGSLAGIAFTVTFTYTLGVKGLLIAVNFIALAVFFISIYFSRKIPFIRWKPAFKNWDKKVLKLLFGFALMNVITGFLTPLSQLFIRDKIIKDFSVSEAGYWQAVTRISDYYLGFITSVLIVYYMPRLSEIQNKNELRIEIKNGYKIILPVVGLMALVIWLFRNLIVQVLFTHEFSPMLPLFKYQLLGDFFKIGSWLLAFIMISKALTKTFIITEIIFAGTYILLCYYFINKYGIIGATYGFCINYALYWVAIWFVLKKKII